ncbi:pfs domain-containing protein [Colletotrichum asianum]|uniref:Pfs domain-containing protein n=1 Tax=Colletotrichum asianum TaxID=702518 RepID=A0A8H3ZV79_9PEZI|nr:pfs domain-containing protein [Colletotrichum asianum]
MVGIGGGAPDKIDIRLGDIVVSHPSSTSSGVIQYDFGKTVQEGHFQRSGTLNKPPQQLLTAVAKLRADHESRPSRIPELLSDMQDRYSMMTAYTYPGAAQDRLYEATYDHIATNCDDCNPSYLVKRSRRIDNNPEIHYGIIASANQVMKHGQTRRRLALDHDVICFEMEAADSHKFKQWQEYAAATAAAYAKELLSAISPEEIHRNHRSRFLDSLRFDEIDSRHSTIKTAHSKTCQWLLKHPDYVRWLNVSEFINHHGILWIRGKPGAGKSTIMKYAFSRAGWKTANNAAVISFFFNARGGSLEKSTEGMHRSLLLQLLEKLPELQEVLEGASTGGFLRSGSQTWSLSELKDFFSRAVAKLGQRQVTCFIDALDECDEIEIRQMLDFFEDLGQNAAQNNIGFYVCFSSRHYPYMDVQYGVRFTLEDQLGHEADLEEYVRGKMRSVTKKQADELTQEILGKASGVFMWVVLVIDILNKEFQRGRMFAVKKRLQEIPPKLSDLFRDILTRDNENMDDLLLSIQWILFAKRPLQLEEYYFALVAGLDRDSLAEWDTEQISGLAEMTKSKNAIVQFIHESVRDFLLKDDGLTTLWPGLRDNPEGRSHERLTTCCHSYTRVDFSAYVPPGEYFLEDHKGSVKILREQVTEKFPLLEYATNQLLYHADTAEGLGVSQELFFQDFSNSLDSWTKLHNLFERFKVRRYTPRTSLLYIISEFGFESLVDSMIRNNTEFSTHSSPGQRFKTPFHAAVNGGHASIVKAFLSHITAEEINKPLRKTETPLCTAVERRHAAVVEMLLEAGADPHMPADLLSRAIETKRQDIVELLLSKHFSVINSRDSHPPVCPAEAGQVTSPQVILRSEIDLVRCSDDVLYRASKHGMSTTVRLLSEKGACINWVPEGFSSALHAAVDSADEYWAKLLIESGVDVNIGPPAHHTPLYRAVSAGEESMVKLLLENGGEADYCHGHKPSGRTLLHLAISMGNKSIVLLLLENGANTDPCGCDVSPLELALRCGAEEISNVLLEKGANVKITDDSGHTPLHIASQKGCVEPVKTMIDLGAVISCIDFQGRTPLSLACQNQHYAIATLLFNRGARLEENNASSGTPYYTEGMHKHVAQLLQLSANDINGRDELGQTPLFQACRLGALDIVKLLLQRGADAKVTDNQNQTALFEIRRSYIQSGRIVRLLVEAGANPLHKNNEGKTFYNASYGFPKLNESRTREIFQQVMQGQLDEVVQNGTLLGHAVWCDDVAEVSFLLYLGANPNKGRLRWRTPILDVVISGSRGVMSHLACLLLEAGADATIADDHKQTPLELAIKYGRTSVAEILRSRLERIPLSQSLEQRDSG